MPFGYNGRILNIDLTRSAVEIEKPSEQWYRTYMGGSSLASYYLLKYVKPGTDPLSENNILVFACSVVCGAPISGFNRFTVASMSPHTRGFGESEAGGYWAPELKFAGFDAVIVRGRAEKPSYLWIKDGDVEIRDASGIWGKNNFETLERIREDLDEKKVRVASIGPAGEKMVPFACIQNDMEHFNGRNGMGAVMGSKHLKAIAVRGSRKMEMADPAKVREIGTWHTRRVKEHPPNVGLTRFGTSILVQGLNDTGILPTRNFSSGVFDGAEKLAAQNYHETIFHSTGTCWACAVRCKRRVEYKDEKYALDKRFGGPEYEALGAFGSMLGIDHLPAVARGNQLCNLLGLDVVSTGGILAFAMECFENNIITRSDTEGVSLEFGNQDAMLWLIEKIAAREGIGAVLSKGVKTAAKKLGKNADQYAFHIKGNELPFHDGRGKTGMALGFALSATGADHIESPHDVAFQGDAVNKLHPLGILEPVKPLETDTAKVKFFVEGQKAWQINNVLGLCNFCSVPIHAMTFPRLVEAVSAVTGWETSLYEILKASERSLVMARVFNNRHGFTSRDDRVIRRWHEKMPDGPLKGQYIEPAEFQDAINLYYEMSGWDSEGKPLKGKLADLSLEWLIE